MSEFKRPQECVNAHCVAMCSPIDYEFCKRCFFDNPRKCPNYKTEPMIPMSVIDNIKAEIKEKGSKLGFETTTDVVFKIAYIEVEKLIDKHISEKRG